MVLRLQKKSHLEAVMKNKIDVRHKSVRYYLTCEKAVYWDRRNENREPVSSSIYFYTLTADHYTQTGRMVIVKSDV